MMRLPGYISVLLALSVLAATGGCKEKEPIPPSTPPPAESQVPSQTPPRADTSASGAQPVPGEPSPSAAESATPPVDATIAPTVAAATVAPDVASGAIDGKKIFATYCQACHGERGEGDGPAAAALNPKPASFATRAFKFDSNGDGARGELEDIVAVIRDGAAKYGGSQMMAPWPTLTKEQQDAVAKHIKTLGARN